MQNEMLQLIAIAAVIAPVTTGFTEMYKQYTPANGKALPVLSIGTGILFGVIFGLTFHPTLLLEYGVAGLLSGLSAMGVYQLVKPTTVQPAATSNEVKLDAAKLADAIAKPGIKITPGEIKVAGMKPQMRTPQAPKAEEESHA